MLENLKKIFEKLLCGSSCCNSNYYTYRCHSCKTLIKIPIAKTKSSNDDEPTQKYFTD